MAKIARATLKVFGDAGGSSNFGQFGSQAASAPVETKDVATIQALSAWDNGWQDAVAIGQAPYLQDMNGWMYVHSRMEAYLFQQGIAEYDSGTTYYIGSVVAKTGTFELYGSLIDNNTGNALPSRVNDSNWEYLGAVSVLYQGCGYRKPNLQLVSVTTVDVEPNTYDNATGVTVLFRDGILRTVNSLTKTRFDITRNAVLSGTVQSGLRNGLTEAADTNYYLYAVVASDDDTTWVTVGDTIEPIPSNYATLNTNFGIGKWRPLGIIRNGDNRGATSDILSFVQVGADTVLTNADNQGLAGYRVASGSSATSLAYSATQGTGATDLPNVAGLVDFVLVSSPTSGYSQYFSDSGGARQAFVLTNTAVGSQAQLRTAATAGAKLVTSVSGTLAINCSGFRDQVLAAGSMAIL